MACIAACGGRVRRELERMAEISGRDWGAPVLARIIMQYAGGEAISEIGRANGVGVATVCNYVRLFIDGGLAALDDNFHAGSGKTRAYRRAKSNNGVTDSLEELLKKSPPGGRIRWDLGSLAAEAGCGECVARSWLLGKGICLSCGKRDRGMVSGGMSVAGLYVGAAERALVLSAGEPGWAMERRLWHGGDLGDAFGVGRWGMGEEEESGICGFLEALAEELPSDVECHVFLAGERDGLHVPGNVFFHHTDEYGWRRMAEFWLGIFSCRQGNDTLGSGRGLRPWKNTVRCGLGLCLEKAGIAPESGEGSPAGFAALPLRAGNCGVLRGEPLARDWRRRDSSAGRLASYPDEP
jgi:hypothetical protein